MGNTPTCVGKTGLPLGRNAFYDFTYTSLPFAQRHQPSPVPTIQTHEHDTSPKDRPDLAPARKRQHRDDHKQGPRWRNALHLRGDGRPARTGWRGGAVQQIDPHTPVETYAQLGQAAKAMTAQRQDPRAWARRILERVAAGEKVGRYARESAEVAMGLRATVAAA